VSSTGQSTYSFGTDHRYPLFWFGKHFQNPNKYVLGFRLSKKKIGRKADRDRESVRCGGACILVELVVAREHDERDLSIAKDGELLSFLDNTIPSFGIGHLPVRLVLDPLDLDLSTTHLSSSTNR